MSVILSLKLVWPSLDPVSDHPDFAYRRKERQKTGLCYLLHGGDVGKASLYQTALTADGNF